MDHTGVKCKIMRPVEYPEVGVVLPDYITLHGHCIRTELCASDGVGCNIAPQCCPYS